MTVKSGIPGDKTITLDVHLLGRDYKVACKEHERAEGSTTSARSSLLTRNRILRSTSRSLFLP